MEGQKHPQFPPEVWTRIFQYLPNEEDRLHYRFVSDYLANIVDGMVPPSPSWTPWFSHHRTSAGEAMMTLRKTPGTKLLCVEDLDKLREQITQQPEEIRKKNPFQNFTLIVNFQNEQVFGLLLDALPEFLAEYGHHIKILLYTFHSGVPKSLENFSSVLKPMAELKGIIFNSSTWGRVDVNFTSFPALPQLCELEILGEYSFPFLAKFLDHYGPQIRNLHWGNHIISTDDFGDNVLQKLFEKTPNLNNFKMGNIRTLPFFHRLGKVHLKGFALRILDADKSRVYFDYFDYLISFRALICLINCFSGTLERLSLHVAQCRMDKVKWHSLEVANFPVLKELSLSTSFLDNPNISLLLEKCPNLITIILLDTENNFVSADNEEFKRKVEGFWGKVDGMKVDKICIRYHRYNRELKRHFPILVEVAKQSVAD